MSVCLINIKNAKYSPRGAQLYYELFSWGLTIHVWSPANLCQHILGPLPTGAWQNSCRRLLVWMCGYSIAWSHEVLGVEPRKETWW